MTINEALGYMKQLKQRHQELSALREENRASRRWMTQTKDYLEEPKYDVKAIDKNAMAVAKEMRVLDAAIKKANAVTELEYTPDESVFAPIE